MSAPPPRPVAALAQRAVATVGRRAWLLLTAAGTGVAGWAGWRHHQGTHPAPRDAAEHEAAMVRQVVHLLVPPDDTPGALALGLHQQLLVKMQANAGLALACGQCFQALDKAARRAHRQDFLTLSHAQQDALMHALVQAGTATEGQPGLVQLRTLAMQLYYAQPATWPALGMAGPPQPAGHMDYTQPPARRT